MARRGSYSKGIAKREEILDKALDLVARAGYRRTTVRELAEAVGLSQAGLLHHFGTKEQLFTEILRRRDEADRRAFTSETDADGNPLDMPEAYVRLVRHNADVPGLVELYTRFSSEAAEAGHPAHDFFHDRYLAARGAAAEGVRRRQEAGQLPADFDAERLAVLITALADGLQVQWMYDSGIDMADHMAYFWELLGRPTEPRRLGP